MRKLFLLVIFVSCCASSVFAQDRPRPEFFGGFSVDNIYTDLEESGFENAKERDKAFGFDASVTGYFNRRFGIEGDVDGHFKRKTLGAVACTGLDCPPPSFRIHISSFNFMAGPHVRFPTSNSRITPFAHALAGGNHFRVGADFEVEDVTRSETDFALKLGGGVDLGISEHAAVRLLLDYNPVFEKDPEEGGHRTRNDGIFSVGLVFK
jgi:opacity protein-like surface antigen